MRTLLASRSFLVPYTQVRTDMCGYKSTGSVSKLFQMSNDTVALCSQLKLF